MKNSKQQQQQSAENGQVNVDALGFDAQLDGDFEHEEPALKVG